MTQATYPVTGSVLTGVTPNAISCGTVNQFVVIADADNPYDVRWCAIGDPTSWPTPNTDAARAVQAGRQTLDPNHGCVTGISGDDFFGYVFQEKGITKMTYVGGDVVFTFDTFEESRGCFQYNRYVRVENTVYFESEVGYHAVRDGIVADIGYGSVDRDFTPRVQPEQFSVVSNETRRLIRFSEQGIDYNYKTEQWTQQGSSQTKNFNLSSETGLFGRLAELTTSGFGLTTDEADNPQDATFETGHTDLNPGGRAILTGVKPLVNGGTVTVRVGSRDDLSDTPTYTTATSLTTRTGIADFRVDARYHQVEITITGGFDSATGCYVYFEPSGRI